MRFLLRITSAHGCQAGECLYTLAGTKIPASAQITFKLFFFKLLAIRVHIFSLNMYRGLSLLQFELPTLPILNFPEG